MTSSSRYDGSGEGTGLRSTLVAIVCASFSIAYVIVVLGCSTFCLSRGHDCGGDGQIYYLPFLLFPFALMTSVIVTLTLCSRLTSVWQMKVALAAMVALACPSALAVFAHHEIVSTTIIFLLPVTACLVGGAAYLCYALARRTVMGAR